VPGLIPGASEGRGLGLEFLRHVERCAVLVHVLDCATLEPDRDPISDLDVIEAELAAYAGDLQIEGGRVPLTERPQIVVLNKIDVPEARELAEFVTPDLVAAGYRVLAISAVTHEGLAELRFALAEVVAADRADRPTPPAPRIVVRPQAIDSEQFQVEPDPGVPGGFIVRGTRPERWILQTDFNNNEAVGYLADRLARLGVEAHLAAHGAQPGAPVTIGSVTFDWEPTTLAGVDVVPTGRGTDLRLDQIDRVGAAERKVLHRLRRGLDVDGHSLDEFGLEDFGSDDVSRTRSDDVSRTRSDDVPRTRSDNVTAGEDGRS